MRACSIGATSAHLLDLISNFSTRVHAGRPPSASSDRFTRLLRARA